MLADLYGPLGAEVYHDLAARDVSEIAELTKAVRGAAGPVLELAAGAGRLTFPLLASGREVTALDLSDDLIRLLRQRLAQAPARWRARCTIVRGDMSRFSVPGLFGAVVLGTTSISLLDGPARRGLYRCVAAHLRPAGRFLLTTRSRAAGTPPPAESESSVKGASGRRYVLGESWLDLDTRRVTVTAQDGPPATLTSVVRDVPADLLAGELSRAGFTLLGRHPIPAVAGWEHTLLVAEGGAP